MVVGAGFAGLAAAQALAAEPVDITVIDHKNYHVFQPLLYQVATGQAAEHTSADGRNELSGGIIRRRPR